MAAPTSVPINIFENERELVAVVPMPGVDVTDISVDVADDGTLTVRARQHGEGQDRVEHLVREWSYGPYERSVALPRRVDGARANLAFGNGVLAVTLPKAADTVPGHATLDETGEARGVARGHVGSRGGASSD